MFCRKCGKELREGDEFCGSCGASTKSDVTEAAPNSGEIAQGNVAVTHKKTAPIVIVGGIVLVVLIVLIKIIFFSPVTTFKGNDDDPQKLIEAANFYLSSSEYKNRDANLYELKAFDFIGKLGNYYQFRVAGKEFVNGIEIEYTEDDNRLIVLTETEDGISYVPTSKWSKTLERRSTTGEVYFVCKVYYDYSTGNLAANMTSENNMSRRVTVERFEIDFVDGNGNVVASGSLASYSVPAGTRQTKKYYFDGGNTYLFLPDLSELDWKTSYEWTT